MKNYTPLINCKPIFLFLFLYLPALSFAQLQFTNWKEKPIDSKVKEITIWSYRYPNKDDSVLWNRKSYNDKGLLVSEKGYVTHDDDRNYKTIEYVYDSLNRIIEETNIKYGRKHVYKSAFNTLNKSVRMDHFMDTSLYEYTIWQYNEKGWITSMIAYGKDNSIEREDTFEYSDNGKTITRKNEDYFGGRVMYKLSPKNDVIEMIGFLNDSVISVVTYLTYDKKGNLLEEKETEPVAIRKITLHTYDRKGSELAIYVCDRFGKKRLIHEKTYKKGLLDTVTYYDEKEMPEVKEVYTYVLRD